MLRAGQYWSALLDRREFVGCSCDTYAAGVVRFGPSAFGVSKRFAFFGGGLVASGPQKPLVSFGN